MATEQTRERTQFSFEIDDLLSAEIDEVLAQVPGLKKAVLGRAALNDKLQEIRQKLANGEKVAVTI